MHSLVSRCLFSVLFPSRCDQLVHISPKCSLKDLGSPIKLSRETYSSNPNEVPSRPPLPTDIVDGLVLQFTPAKESMRPIFELSAQELNLARKYAQADDVKEAKDIVQHSPFLTEYTTNVDQNAEEQIFGFQEEAEV